MARDVEHEINANSVIVILIEQDGRFLLFQERRENAQNVWYFPAGAVEAGESLVDAARREALEETGWSVIPTHLLRIDHGLYPRAPRLTWWRHVIVARPDPGVAPIAPEDDVLAVEWLTLDDLTRRCLRSEDALEIIRSYLDAGPGMDLANYRFADDGTLPGFYA